MIGKTKVEDPRILAPIPIPADAVRFYGRTKPDPAYWAFSNFYPSAIKVGKVWYQTTEHYYQAMKYTDPKVHEYIRTQQTPREAMREARRPDLPLREDWENVKVEVMYDALVHKFTQHEDLKTILMGTGERYIVEDSPIDYFWGCGRDGSGKNVLGRLLMLLRHGYRR